MMPRKARTDAPDALHHVMCRGIELRTIFDDDVQPDNFLKRLGTILKEMSTSCYGWALVPNHFRVKARSLVCYWAFRELGISGTSVSKLLGIGQPAVRRAIVRGENWLRIFI